MTYFLWAWWRPLLQNFQRNICCRGLIRLRRADLLPCFSVKPLMAKTYMSKAQNDYFQLWYYPASHWCCLPRRHLIQRIGLVETVRYEKRIERPHMMELIFSKVSSIDVQDHYRQSSLTLERQWLTSNWSFSTLLEMVAVDSFLAYRYDMVEEGHAHLSWFRFSACLSIDTQQVRCC